MLLAIFACTLVTLAYGQSVAVAYAEVASKGNIRLVYPGTSCSGFARAEVWKNTRWNAVSDCGSTRDVYSTEATDFCHQIGDSSSGSSAFSQSSSVSSSSVLTAPSDTSLNRVYSTNINCLSSNTNSVARFCDGCSGTLSTSFTSTCPSSVRTSSSTSSTSPGMLTSRAARDVYISCVSVSPCTQVSIVDLYAAPQNAPTSAPSCNLNGSTSGSVSSAAGGIIAAIIISICCCIFCVVIFYAVICGGGLLCGVALCGCLGYGTARSTQHVAVAQSTAVSNNNQNNNNQTVNVVVQAPPTQQYPTQGQPMASMPMQPMQQPGYQPQQGYPPQQAGYPPQQGYPQQYAPAQGAAPGYAPQQGYPPQQQGYPPQQQGYQPQQQQGYPATAPGGAPPAYAPQY